MCIYLDSMEPPPADYHHHHHTTGNSSSAAAAAAHQHQPGTNTSVPTPTSTTTAAAAVCSHPHPHACCRPSTEAGRCTTRPKTGACMGGCVHASMPGSVEPRCHHHHHQQRPHPHQPCTSAPTPAPPSAHLPPSLHPLAPRRQQQPALTLSTSKCGVFLAPCALARVPRSHPCTGRETQQ